MVIFHSYVSLPEGIPIASREPKDLPSCHPPAGHWAVQSRRWRQAAEPSRNFGRFLPENQSMVKLDMGMGRNRKNPCSSHKNSWYLWMFIVKMVCIAIDPWPYFEDCPYFEMVTFPWIFKVRGISWTSQLQLGIQAEIFCGITSNWCIITLTQNVGNMILYIMDDGMVQHFKSAIYLQHSKRYNLPQLPWWTIVFPIRIAMNWCQTSHFRVPKPKSYCFFISQF